MGSEARKCELATVSLADNDYEAEPAGIPPSHCFGSEIGQPWISEGQSADSVILANGSRRNSKTRSSVSTADSGDDAVAQIDHSSDMDFCEEHESKLDWYCSSEAKLVCSQCVAAGSCHGHIVTPVTRRATVIRNQLVDVCEKMQLQASRIERFLSQTLVAKEQALQVDASAARERVVARLNLVREALEEEEQRLLEAVQREEERVQQCLLTQKAHWTQALDSLTHTRTRLVHTLTHTMDAKLVNSSQDIAERVEEAEGVGDPIDTEKLTMKFGCSESKLIMGLWASAALLGHMGHTPINLTFDDRTVSPLLSLSPDQRTLTFLSKRARRNPQYDPARFDSWPNALCSRLFSSGTHSWVVDVSQSDAFKVGVCYASLERKGSSDASRLGYNARSWVLSHFEDVISFCHAARHDYLSVVQKPRRIGILLDWPGCTLLFFDADSGTTLHTVCHPFTAPLLPACAVGNRSITLVQP
ncbi:B box and SPRY domain-containing protein isoform X1 [Brienomyrus brachyistius]|uniref:B box and SPRY domain-containing protein isoform X1 n=1 Tax=Brienomyrus brachyistius TaxID=42636 RepID=UPI0020B2B604|nr:B box and SPRY domain-containing protein isoform X1 [Brienomyrus brachyistius]